MKILLANPRCYCAGVDRAIQIVDLCLDQFGPPVYVRKEIVHNRFVVGRLRQRGAVFVEDLNEVPDDAMVVFSAHGVAPSVHKEAKRRNLRYIDATCPLVSKVHFEVLRFVAEGFHIVLIGHDGHDEVIGTMGHSPDNITLVENAEQARTKEIPPHDKLMVLTQTTLSVDDTEAVLTELRRRFSNLQLPPADDICYATQNRQNAVKEMCARGMDLLIVIGSQNSSNAHRLVETAKTRGARGLLIDGADEIDADHLADAVCVGVTGAASTPDELVHQTVRRLQELGGDEVERVTTAEETTVFQLPQFLKDAQERFAASDAQ